MTGQLLGLVQVGLHGCLGWCDSVYIAHVHGEPRIGLAPVALLAHPAAQTHFRQLSSSTTNPTDTTRHAMVKRKRQDAANTAADEDGPGPSGQLEDPLTSVVYIGYGLDACIL